jgi:hypothetical protein
MAALYGRLQGGRGEATRTGTKSSGIHATLETWEGKIYVDLEADGSFTVALGPKGYGSAIVATGNVGNDGRYLKLAEVSKRCVHCGWSIIADDEGCWTHTDGDSHSNRERYLHCEGFMPLCVATPSLEVAYPS